MDDLNNIEEQNKEQKGGDVMTKKHFITISTMHKDDCVYNVKFASTSRDMYREKYVSMIGKITPKKSKEDEVKEIVEEDVQTNASLDGVIDLVVKNEDESVEIPLFMEIDRINRMHARRIAEIDRMYARCIEEINRELESPNKKIVHKKTTSKKKSFHALLTKILK